MSFKTVLKIGGENFDLLSYHNHFFYPCPYDKMFYSKSKEIEDPLALFGSWHKYDCWKFNLVEGYDHPKDVIYAYKPRSNLFGGVFTFVIESAGKEENFGYCMSTHKDDRVPLICGEIEFYNGRDEFLPFQRIEFWDGFVCELSESFSSIGNEPMTMQVTISPATIRVNRTVVFQQNWWQTDINGKEGKVVEEKESAISRIFWKGREQGQERKDIMLNHSITLQVEFSDYRVGDSVELTVKQSKGRRIKGQSKEFSVNGVIEDGGIMYIDSFKVECDFKEDNQDFENIEFYYKGNKVGELKENFGWTYIKDKGLLKIFVNIELVISLMASGCTEDDYKRTINDQFKRTLELSSGGLVTGEIFFSGTFTHDPPQYVPIMTFGEERMIMGSTEQGSTKFGKVEILTSTLDNANLLLDIGETAIHELFHTLRLDHPFEITQTKDTELIMDQNNKSLFTTTPNTDPNILYNIMNYNNVTINGHYLDNLWKTKRPDYITKGQIRFIFEQIDLQQKGEGSKTVESEENILVGITYKVPKWENYWVYGIPGIWLEPSKNYWTKW